MISLRLSTRRENWFLAEFVPIISVFGISQRRCHIPLYDVFPNPTHVQISELIHGEPSYLRMFTPTRARAPFSMQLNPSVGHVQ